MDGGSKSSVLLDTKNWGAVRSAALIDLRRPQRACRNPIHAVQACVALTDHVAETEQHSVLMQPAVQINASGSGITQRGGAAWGANWEQTCAPNGPELHSTALNGTAPTSGRLH
jgi:hypothetical protein